MKKLEKIQEVAYLNVENTEKYRAIMRIMFTNHSNSNMQMNKEDILNSLRKEDINMSVEEITPLLNQLVDWGNLGSVIDNKKVRTIEEYKNRSYIYTLTPISIEIERLTLKLESLYIESSVLTPSLFKRIYNSIKIIPKCRQMESKDLNEWWRNLLDDFKRLNQSYLDFIHQFYDSKADVFLKSVEFIVFKDRFLDYLKSFVKELKDYQRNIEIELLKLSDNEIKELIEQIIKSELDIPRSNLDKIIDLEDNIKRSVNISFKNIYNWFVEKGNPNCEAFKIYDKTNEIIRRIITNISLLVNNNSYGQSKKEDYRKLLNLIFVCDSMEEIQSISSMVFGVQKTSHYLINANRETESSNSRVYEETPQTFEIKPTTRKYSPKVDKEGFFDNSFELLAEMDKLNKRIEDEKNQILKYMKNGEINLKEINEVISENMRKIILSWIGTANINNTDVGISSFGEKFRVIKSNDRIDLKCDDGILNMPNYTFIFEGLKNE